MQRLAMDLVCQGMISAIDVTDTGGGILIRSGRPLQETHIQMMRTLGYGSAYVDLPGLHQDRPAEDLLRPDFRREAIQMIRHSYEEFRTRSELDGNPLRELASRLVDEVILDRDRLFQFVDLRTPDTYLPAHVLSVAVLSVRVGLKMEYSPAKLLDLAIGALVMDIGEMLAPPEILRKKGHLAPEEMQEIKKHPEAGFEGLRRKARGLPATSLHVAYQHHESFDGKGYPRELAGTGIHEFARIAGVADMFDALLSDRPFRRYYLPHEAAGILRALSGRLLDPEIVPHFLSSIALYPQGSLVQLDTQELAAVESVQDRQPDRPRLRLLTDAWGNRRSDPESIELLRHQSRYIQKVLKDQEILDAVSL